jgi:hypothetical protein
MNIRFSKVRKVVYNTLEKIHTHTRANIYVLTSIYTVYRLEMQLRFLLSLFLTLSLSRYMFRQ